MQKLVILLLLLLALGVCNETIGESWVMLPFPDEPSFLSVSVCGEEIVVQGSGLNATVGELKLAESFYEAEAVRVSWGKVGTSWFSEEERLGGKEIEILGITIFRWGGGIQIYHAWDFDGDDFSGNIIGERLTFPDGWQIESAYPNEVHLRRCAA